MNNTTKIEIMQIEKNKNKINKTADLITMRFILAPY